MKQNVKWGSSALSKSMLIVSGLIFSLLLPSCNPVDSIYEMESGVGQQTVQNSRTVSFHLSTLIQSQTPFTRAATITKTPTRLLVLDYLDGQLNQTVQFTSDENQKAEQVTLVENVLDNLTLTLKYGSHDIYILATAVPFANYDADAETKTVSWAADNRMSFVWAKKVSLTVEQGTTESQSLELPLVMGYLSLKCSDVQDTNIEKMQISGYLCWTLDLETMKGIAPTTPWSYSISIPKDKNTAGLPFGTYSFQPDGEQLSSVTYTALNAAGQEITHHTLTNVPLTAGYITNYTGLFYNNTQEFSLSTTMDWTGTKEYTY